jgi:hypothetical protein
MDLFRLAEIVAHRNLEWGGGKAFLGVEIQDVLVAAGAIVQQTARRGDRFAGGLHPFRRGVALRVQRFDPRNQPQIAQSIKGLEMDGGDYLQSLRITLANGDVTKLEFVTH